MAKSYAVKGVPRSQHKDFLKKSEDFYQEMQNALVWENWNAAALLGVHTAISAADALAIKLAGVRSRGESHFETLSLLREMSLKNKQGITHLRRIIEMKSVAAYEGDSITEKKARALADQVERFRTWAQHELG